MKRPPLRSRFWRAAVCPSLQFGRGVATNLKASVLPQKADTLQNQWRSVSDMAKKKPRVLIAEDEAHVRRLLRSILESINCEIAGEAEDGAAAVSQYMKLKPHMLLLDINMPVKTGKAALAEVRKRHANAFVIMITSLADKDTVEECRKLGASGFIRKDLPIDEIKAVIRKTWRAYREAMSQEAGADK